MSRYEDDEGNTVDIDYDKDHDTTQWETRDAAGNQTGGGQRGGNAVDDLAEEFKGQGYSRSDSD